MSHKWNTLKTVFTHIYIPHGEKTIFLSRLEDIYTHIHLKSQRTEKRYFWSKAYVIFVGIVNPALLTVAADHCTNSLLYSIIYWSIWSLQISSSVITTLSSMVRFDKKHFAYVHYKNRIDEEIWAFVELRDAYSQVDQSMEYERMYHRTFHYTKYKRLLANCERIYKNMCTNACKDNMSIMEDEVANGDDGTSSTARAYHQTDTRWTSPHPHTFRNAPPGTAAPPPPRHSLSMPCPVGFSHVHSSCVPLAMSPPPTRP